MTIPRTRTITMTDRAPVQIISSEWPVIARADGDSYVGNDYACHQQALGSGELDEYTLRVRQHTDGRSIVYGVLAAAHAWTEPENHRGGQLLDPGDDIPAAIRRVGEECGLPDHVIRSCIADLPAVTI